MIGAINGTNLYGLKQPWTLGTSLVTAKTWDQDSYVQGRPPHYFWVVSSFVVQFKVHTAHMLHDYATVLILPTPPIFVLKEMYTSHCLVPSLQL